VIRPVTPGSTDDPLTPSLSLSEWERVPFRAGEGFRETRREPLALEVFSPNLPAVPGKP